MVKTRQNIYNALQSQCGSNTQTHIPGDRGWGWKAERKYTQRLTPLPKVVGSEITFQNLEENHTRSLVSRKRISYEAFTLKNIDRFY